MSDLTKEAWKLVPMEPGDTMLEAGRLAQKKPRMHVSHTASDETISLAIAYRAMVSASPSPAQEPVAWLIEWPDDGNLHPLRWWHGEFGYTRDPNKTPRFARREDAEMAIKYLKLVGAKAVEHMWMNGKVTHPSPSPSLTKAREALRIAREAIWSGGDTIRTIAVIDDALAALEAKHD